jgi:hypothetical protein
MRAWRALQGERTSTVPPPIPTTLININTAADAIGDIW